MSTQPRRPKIEVQESGDVTVVSFTDRKILDEQNIQSIGEQLYALVEDGGKRKMVLNFSRVEYLNRKRLLRRYRLIVVDVPVNDANQMGLAGIMRGESEFPLGIGSRVRLFR